MKALFAASLLVLSLTPRSYAGPRSDGGGNLLVRVNSVEKVNTALDQAKEEAIEKFGLLIMRRGLGKSAADPALKEILRAMVKGSSPMPMGSYIDGSAFQTAVRKAQIVRQQGPCLSRQGHIKDSSVAEDKPGTAICMSIPSLLRVDDEFLQDQISALIAHEVAHQFGADEETAVKVQEAVFQASQHTAWVFDYVGVNVRIINEEQPKPTLPNATIKIKGADAKALYDALDVKPYESPGDEDIPASLVKKGESYFCVKYLPVREDSAFAQSLARWGRKLVRTYDYACQVNLRRESGKVIRL